jgi:hypothetical protein
MSPRLWTGCSGVLFACLVGALGSLGRDAGAKRARKLHVDEARLLRGCSSLPWAVPKSSIETSAAPAQAQGLGPAVRGAGNAFALPKSSEGGKR